MTTASELHSAPHSRSVFPAAHANARQLAGAPGLFYSDPAVLVLTSRRGGPVPTPEIPSRFGRSRDHSILISRPRRFQRHGTEE